VITNDIVEKAIQQQVVRYDKQGEMHYDVISAYIKSIRNSDPDAAVYYLARMLTGGEDPKFIARRLIIAASEDVGLDLKRLSIWLQAQKAILRMPLSIRQWQSSKKLAISLSHFNSEMHRPN